MNTNPSQNIVTQKFLRHFHNDTKKVLSSMQNAKNNNNYDWINQSYPHIIKFFNNKKKFNDHDVIIGCYIIYGWMPTMLDNFNVYNNNNFTRFLNRAKKHNQNRRFASQDIESIASYINNSIIGASKVLHFINPDVYAIWDSRVFKYLHKNNLGFVKYMNSSPRRSKLYIRYLGLIKELSKDTMFNKNKISFEKIINYPITNNRFAEYIMYFHGE